MISRLQIETGTRENKTFLKNCFFTTPFKVANITENRSENCLHLMLMTSSPGILDGDEYQLSIELSERSCLKLHTQSYQRLFNMKKGATQSMKVYMKKNTSFCYLPHPSVPHESSDFVATNKIFLAGGCELIFGEVLTCGRKLSGEKFKFSRFHNVTEIFLNERLIIKENLLVQPAKINVQAIGQFEGFSHQASLIYLNEVVKVNGLISEINELLLVEQNICFGVSALPVNGIVVRLLGHKAEQLHNILQTIADFINATKSNDRAGERCIEKTVSHAD